MKRSRGKMSKRSRLLRKRRGRKLGTTRLVKKFSIGDRVRIDIKSGYFGNMPHPRYRGKHGIIVGVRGKSYIVELRHMKSIKKLIIPPVHLERA